MHQPKRRPEGAEPKAATALVPGHMPLSVSVDQAARTAGIGRSTIYEAIAAGELKSLTVGRRRLIRIAALDEWLRDKELPA